jgi:hypothetical protein
VIPALERKVSNGYTITLNTRNKYVYWWLCEHHKEGKECAWTLAVKSAKTFYNIFLKLLQISSCDKPACNKVKNLENYCENPK